MESPGDRVSAWLAEGRAWSEARLEALVPPADTTPPRLFAALRYSLFGGGKRLRPSLVRHFCRHAGGDDEAAARPAAALELVHTYSLIHDDLPCMDDDGLRRGRPTCHVAFDEATALLAGDALLTLAFEVVAHPTQPGAAQLAHLLARAAGGEGMVGGQVLDLFLEEDAGRAADLSLLLDMHARKTAALFAAACEMGCVAGGAEAAVARTAREYGLALGLLFQATDDLLDVTGDAATLGKTPGKDAALARPTLVALAGLEGAQAEAQRLGERARSQAQSLGCGPGDPIWDLVDFVLTRRA